MARSKRLRSLLEPGNMRHKARLDIDHYAMLLACVARLRSEDPWLKVGSVALSPENRLIAAAYNGPRPGFVAKRGFWEDRDRRRPYIIHSEINLCSLFKRGEAKIVAVTTMPCSNCATALIASGIKRLVWGEPYKRDAGGLLILREAGIEVVQVKPGALKKALAKSGVRDIDGLLGVL